MLVLNGKKYAKNNNEFMESLFVAGGTCNGFYKKTKNGVKLYDMQNNLQAFIRNDGLSVSAFLHEGKMRYMYGMDSRTEAWLGFDVLKYSDIYRVSKEALSTI